MKPWKKKEPRPDWERQVAGIHFLRMSDTHLSGVGGLDFGEEPSGEWFYAGHVPTGCRSLREVVKLINDHGGTVETEWDARGRRSRC